LGSKTARRASLVVAGSAIYWLVAVCAFVSSGLAPDLFANCFSVDTICNDKREIAGLLASLAFFASALVYGTAMALIARRWLRRDRAEAAIPAIFGP
jgi:hypothetical protein